MKKKEMFDPKIFVKDVVGRKCSIVMVTFNRWNRTCQSLLSIFKNTHMPYVLTVVDNASWDDTREKLKRLRRTARISKLILLPENVGIGKGKNFGLKAWQGKADWHCCIDNDIKVSPYWLSYLCYASMLPGLGVIGCNVQGFGTRRKGFIPTLWKSVDGIILDNCPNPGGIYVMSKSTFETLGYFREFSLYGLEDSELYSRQKHHGLRSAYVRNVACEELPDEAFKMRTGETYRSFKTTTHNAIFKKNRELRKKGKYRIVEHYETKVTLREIEKYTWKPQG